MSGDLDEDEFKRFEESYKRFQEYSSFLYIIEGGSMDTLEKLKHMHTT